MSFRDGPLEDLKVPLTWTATAALIAAILAAAYLLLNDRRETADARAGAAGAARGAFDQVAAPAGSAVSAPVRWIGGGIDYVAGYFDAVEENRRLREEVRGLRRWRDAAIALKDVNQRYEALLRLRTQPPVPMIAARVVLDARGPLATTRLADAGSERGVRAGHPALSEHGVLGRVAGVTRGASRILLLTDPASRTPVLIDRTDARAILTGDGGSSPRLEFLRGAAPLRKGDLILTSGDGGLFPRGLPVGVAVRGMDGVWRARLYADRGAIDYVRILMFDDFTRTVDAEALDRTSPPLGGVGAGAPAPTIQGPPPEARP